MWTKKIGSTGWWFGPFFIFPYILGIIIPIDFHIFQMAWNHQPGQVWSSLHDRRMLMKEVCLPSMPIPNPETKVDQRARRISEVKLVGELSFTDWCFIETWDIMKLDFESSNRKHMNAWFGWLKIGNQRILISTIQVQSFTQLWYCVGLKLVLPCLSKASDHVIHSKHVKLLHLGSFPCQQVHMQPIPSTYGRVLSWSTEMDSHAYNENPVFLI